MGRTSSHSYGLFRNTVTECDTSSDVDSYATGYRPSNPATYPVAHVKDFAARIK
jgi:hypothetical protein